MSMSMLYNPHVKPIEEFTGDYRFLSNFYTIGTMDGIEYEHIRFPTTEHAYQAAKTLDESVRLWFQIDACKNCHHHASFHKRFAILQLPYCPTKFNRTGEPVDWHSTNSFRQVKAGDAKRMGRRVEMRPDWDEVKLEVMLDVLRLKFAVPYLRDKLLATENCELVENNAWGDRYWGRVFDEGENHLGKLLMKVRQELRKARP